MTGWDLPPGCSQQDCDGELPLAARLARNRCHALNAQLSDLFVLANDICHQSAIDGAVLETEAESDIERDRRLR
jgi:hypothetical protein